MKIVCYSIVLGNLCDPLREIPHFMKIKIRPEIGIWMCNCEAVKKTQVIGCLVPELWSEMPCGRGKQLFKETQCLYVVTENFNVSVYYQYSMMDL